MGIVPGRGKRDFLKKDPFSPSRTLPLFFKNVWNGLQVFADTKILQSCFCFKGENGDG